jgi:hypothetical protein
MPVMSGFDAPIREEVARKIIEHHNRVQQALIDLVDDSSEQDIGELTGLSEARCKEIHDIAWCYENE